MSGICSNSMSSLMRDNEQCLLKGRERDTTRYLCLCILQKYLADTTSNNLVQSNITSITLRLTIWTQLRKKSSSWRWCEHVLRNAESHLTQTVRECFLRVFVHTSSLCILATVRSASNSVLQQSLPVYSHFRRFQSNHRKTLSAFYSCCWCCLKQSIRVIVIPETCFFFLRSHGLRACEYFNERQIRPMHLLKQRCW